jgi:hypothetical protein
MTLQSHLRISLIPNCLRAQRRYQKCRKCEENDSKDEIARAPFTMEKPDELFCS